MKNVKDVKKNSIIILIISLIVLFFVLKDSFKEILSALIGMNYFYFIIAILLFLLSIYIRYYIFYLSANSKKYFTSLEAFKHGLITQFFNGITPFSTGGQPMEIYMLTNHHISVSKATSIVIQNFIYYQTALVIFGLVAVIYNAIFHIFPNVKVLGNLVFLGFLINTLVAVGLFAITWSEKTTKKVANLSIKFLSKIKVIKDQTKVENSIEDKLMEFHTNARELRHKKGLFFIGVLANFISLAFLYAVPLFVAYALHDYTSLHLFDTITASAYVLLIGAFVPIPGASGGIEYGFIKFFGNFLPTITLNSALIVWRFITYYLGMILGALLLSTERRDD